MMDFEYRDGAIVAIKPPPGITPNFENPETKAPQLISVVVGFLTVTSFFVLLRVYTRIYISKAFGIDDYFSIISLAIATVFAAVKLRMIHYGFGIHIWEVPIEKITPGFMAHLIAATAVYSVLNFFVKATVLLLFYRIFKQSVKIRFAIFTVLFFVFSYNVADLVASLNRCSPAAMTWDWTITSGSCNVDGYTLTRVVGAFNVFTDFLILALPIPHIMSLNLATGKKLVVIGVLMTGSLACVGSIIRLRWLMETRHGDLSWVLIDACSWSAIETDLGIICACMPCLNPLARRVMPVLLKSFHSRSSQASDQKMNANPKAEARSWPLRPFHHPSLQGTDLETGKSSFFSSSAESTRIGSQG